MLRNTFEVLTPDSIARFRKAIGRPCRSARTWQCHAAKSVWPSDDDITLRF